VSLHSQTMQQGAAETIGIRLSLQDIVVGLVVLVLPFVIPDFFVFQIAAQALVLGVIATSLAFLVGGGGLLSLSQMSVAGVAAYLVAIFGSSSVESISLGLPWWAAVPLAIGLATVLGVLIGMVAIRTEGIYTLMITLAIGVAMFYLAQQNYAIFNGFQGFAQVAPPALFGIAWNSPTPFYYLAAAVGAFSFLFHRYILDTPFGLALQGTRDNPRRMRALGFNVNAHRVAAYAVAAFIAALGGVLLVWYNGRVSPGTIGTAALFNILIIAVLGGIRSPAGPFVGALVFVLLQNFAIDLVDRERFNLVIGGVFLAAVLFSPDGLVGMWKKFATAAASRRP
jgi:branched-chain amino acid transport system permease protein